MDIVNNGTPCEFLMTLFRSEGSCDDTDAAQQNEFQEGEVAKSDLLVWLN